MKANREALSLSQLSTSDAYQMAAPAIDYIVCMYLRGVCVHLQFCLSAPRNSFFTTQRMHCGVFADLFLQPVGMQVLLFPPSSVVLLVCRRRCRRCWFVSRPSQFPLFFCRSVRKEKGRKGRGSKALEFYADLWQGLSREGKGGEEG